MQKRQEDAHKKVKRAVVGAQEAHDLMAELSEEVDRLREGEFSPVRSHSSEKRSGLPSR